VTTLTGTPNAAAVNPWVSSNTSIASVTNAGVVSGIAAGTVSITYTNINGCSQNLSFIVNALPVINGTLSVCTGSAVTLSGSTPANPVAPWLSSSLSVATVSSLGIVTGVSAGTASITYTDLNGCRQTASVTVKPLPAAPTASNSGPICAGGSLTLTASNISGAAYNWSGPNGFTAGIQNPTIINAGTVASGTYSVTATVNGCTGNASITTAVVNIAVTTPLASNNGPVCTGATVSLSTPLVAGATYAWSGPNGFSAASRTPSLVATSSGTYSVIVTASNGCYSSPGTTNVVVNALPSVSITVNGNTVFCQGDSATLTATAASSYSWSSGNITRSIIVKTAGIRSVTITDANGCSNTSQPISITVNPVPLLVVSTISPTCAPATTDITTASVTAGSTAGTILSYWKDTTALVVLVNPSAISNSGTYYIKSLTSAGCSTVKPVKVVINPQPVLVITNPATVCTPDSINLTLAGVTLGSSNGTLLSYWQDSLASTMLSKPASVRTSGTYYIRSVLITTGCSIIKPVSVTINQSPVVVINDPAAVCQPSAIDLTVPLVTQGSDTSLVFSYWVDSANTVALLTPASVKSSSRYFIRGTANNRCSTSKPVNVIVNLLPVGDLVRPSPTYICEGSYRLITTKGNAASYQWYLNGQPINGAVADTFAATQQGIYSVTLISKEGCRTDAGTSAQLSILLNPALRFTVNKRCALDLLSFTNLTDTSSSGNISWAWDFGDGTTATGFSTTHRFMNGGSFPVTLTATNSSCPSFNQTLTTQYGIQFPVPGIRYDTVYAVAGKDIIVNARQIGNKYQWLPTTGLRNAGFSSAVVNISSNTDYTITITTLPGCVTTDSVYVKVITDGEIFVAGGFTPNGDGNNDKAFPLLKGVRRLVYFKIFNRWGNLVFQTNDETPQNGWDGNYNGKPQPVGAYTWIAEAVDGNGQIIRRSGTLSLIR